MRAVACFIAVFIGSAARAADFPLRTSLAAASRTQGVGRTELPLLRRGAGAGAARVLEVMSAKLGAAGRPEVVPGQDRTVASWKDGRTLVIHGDGTKVSFRDDQELRSGPQVPLAERPAKEWLAQVGLQFIQRELADFIRLGAGEKLEPFSTRVEVGIGADVTSRGPPAEQVLTNAVVFTRTVDGVPVLGAGSKVALLINNDGKVAGFDFDWAEYQRTGQRVKVLGAARIQDRVKQLASVQVDAPGAAVQRYECGLFDAGLRHSDPRSAVQGACVVHASERRIVDEAAHARNPADGHVVTATVDVIPIGETVEADSHWPQARMLASGQVGR
jgi:hypothetical protein